MAISHFGDPGHSMVSGFEDRSQAERDAVFERARFARSIAADLQQSGREVNEHTPRNFLPWEQRVTVTTPAGTSVYRVENPRPRVDPHAVRLADAQAARELAVRQQLAGSHSEGHSRFQQRDVGFSRPHGRRSAPTDPYVLPRRADGRIDWSAMPDADSDGE